MELVGEDWGEDVTRGRGLEGEATARGGGPMGEDIVPEATA